MLHENRFFWKCELSSSCSCYHSWVQNQSLLGDTLSFMMTLENKWHLSEPVTIKMCRSSSWIYSVQMCYPVWDPIMQCTHFTISAPIRIITLLSGVSRPSSVRSYKQPLVRVTWFNSPVTVRDGERGKVSYLPGSFIKSCNSTEGKIGQMGGQILLLTPCYHPLDVSGPCGVIKQGGQNMVLTVLEQKQGKKIHSIGSNQLLRYFLFAAGDLPTHIISLQADKYYSTRQCLFKWPLELCKFTMYLNMCQNLCTKSKQTPQTQTESDVILCGLLKFLSTSQ